MNHGHQPGPQWQHRPWTLTWSPVATWIMDISTASARTTEVFRGGFIQKMNSSSSWVSGCCSESGGACGWAACLGGGTCASSRLPYLTLPLAHAALPGPQPSCVQPTGSTVVLCSPPGAAAAPEAPPSGWAGGSRWVKWHSTGLAGGDRSRQAGRWPVPLGGQRTSPTQQALCTTASRHASHLPITPSFIKVMLQSMVCHTVSYFVKTTLHADTYSNESLIWFKVPEAP